MDTAVAPPDIDTIRHLMGKVSRVHAVTGPKLSSSGTDYEDSIAVNLNFSSGAIGSVQVSTFYPMATYRTSFDYEIVCEHGGIAYDSRQVAIHHQLQDQPMQTTFFEGYGHDVAYDEEWSSFAAWVRTACAASRSCRPPTSPSPPAKRSTCLSPPTTPVPGDSRPRSFAPSPVARRLPPLPNPRVYKSAT